MRSAQKFSQVENSLRRDPNLFGRDAQLFKAFVDRKVENAVGFGEVDRKDGAPRVLLPHFDFIPCELCFCHSSTSKRTPGFGRFIRVSKKIKKNLLKKKLNYITR